MDNQMTLRLRALLQEALDLLGSTPTHEPTDVGAARSPIAWGGQIKRQLGGEAGEEFIQGVIWLAGDLGFHPDHVTTWMAFETGRTFDPAVKNPGSSATGLIQFMRKTAVGLGTTVEALAGMSAIKQLNYVYKYLKPFKGRIKDVIDGYLSILFPAAIGKGLSDSVFVQGDSNYAANAGLDANKDHIVSKAEVGARITAMLAEGLKPENIG